MRILLLALGLVFASTASAQSPSQPSLDYSFAEFRFVDVDVAGGDGFSIGGSIEMNGNWFLLGSLTDIGFNNDVDSFTIELGGGYIWPYRPDWDLLATVQYVNVDVDTPFGSVDDSGLALAGGIRGLIAPQFEVRGSVNHVTIGDDDTFLEIAGDYYFNEEFAAGLTFDIGGDVDTFSVGVRWFFD